MSMSCVRYFTNNTVVKLVKNELYFDRSPDNNEPLAATLSHNAMVVDKFLSNPDKFEFVGEYSSTDDIAIRLMNAALSQHTYGAVCDMLYNHESKTFVIKQHKFNDDDKTCATFLRVFRFKTDALNEIEYLAEYTLDNARPHCVKIMYINGVVVGIVEITDKSGIVFYELNAVKKLRPMYTTIIVPHTDRDDLSWKYKIIYDFSTKNDDILIACKDRNTNNVSLFNPKRSVVPTTLKYIDEPFRSIYENITSPLSYARGDTVLMYSEGKKCQVVTIDPVHGNWCGRVFISDERDGFKLIRDDAHVWEFNISEQKITCVSSKGREFKFSTDDFPPPNQRPGFTKPVDEPVTSVKPAGQNSVLITDQNFTSLFKVLLASKDIITVSLSETNGENVVVMNSEDVFSVRTICPVAADFIKLHGNKTCFIKHLENEMYVMYTK